MEYEVQDDFAGRQGRCKGCGATMTIPSGAAPAPAPAPAAGQSIYAQQAAPQSVYAPPPVPGAPPPIPAKRPASVTVIAILQIIFNALGLLGVLFAVLQLTGVWVQTRGSEVVSQDSVQRTWGIIRAPVAGIVGVLWIVVCVGLLRVQRWARSTALGLVVVDILLAVVGVVMTIYTYQTGAWDKLIRQQPEEVRSIMSISLVLGIVFAIMAVGYYVLLLILLNRKVVVSAFDAADRPQQMLRR